MASSYCLMLGGKSTDATLMQLIASTEIEESMDMPSAIQLTVPLSRSSAGELTYASDPRFGPLAPVSVVTSTDGSGAQGVTTCATGAAASTIGSGSAPAATECIFDGYIISQKLHLETGVTNSTVTVSGQDVSCLMNLKEKVREWVNVTEAQVAAQIFGGYRITPSDQNRDEDWPTYTEDNHSLMQRGSDIAFLRMLARRSGKLVRIACADRPGVRTGYFAAPNLKGNAAINLAINDNTNWTVNALDLDWDITRPTAVTARAALFNDRDPNGANGDVTDSGLGALSDQSLSAFAGKDMTVLLATAVDSGGALTQRARGVLREAGWFAKCEGEADVERLGVVLRAGMLVNLVGVGAMHSGKWVVWTVRHRLTQEKHTMRFTLLRNAVGASHSGASGSPTSLAGVG
jgi:hypothetical protein